MNESTTHSSQPSELVEVGSDVASSDAILKACYWFSRDFVCDIQHAASSTSVSLYLKPNSTRTLEGAAAELLSSIHDFALRERVSAKTDGVRDLLLAKAFSESGVLEDTPSGIFGDVTEESKPDGMFKILSNR